jgi:hypothetical protein
MANTATPTKMRRQHTAGYEHAMQFRGATTVWLTAEIIRVATALDEETRVEDNDRLRMAHLGGLIEGYSTLLSEIVRSA